jgi:hypothetical protein
MHIGEILRYGQARNSEFATVDGLTNFFYETHASGLPLVGMERGISPIAQVQAPDGKRRPAVLIRSSPHRVAPRLPLGKISLIPTMGTFGISATTNRLWVGPPKMCWATKFSWRNSRDTNLRSWTFVDSRRL